MTYKYNIDENVIDLREKLEAGLVEDGGLDGHTNTDTGEFNFCYKNKDQRMYYYLEGKRLTDNSCILKIITKDTLHLLLVIVSLALFVYGIAFKDVAMVKVSIAALVFSSIIDYLAALFLKNRISNLEKGRIWN